eukprot:359094-Chlamydomonas_euryale.AAC.3
MPVPGCRPTHTAACRGLFIRRRCGAQPSPAHPAYRFVRIAVYISFLRGRSQAALQTDKAGCRRRTRPMGPTDRKRLDCGPPTTGHLPPPSHTLLQPKGHQRQRARRGGAIRYARQRRDSPGGEGDASAAAHGGAASVTVADKSAPSLPLRQIQRLLPTNVVRIVSRRARRSDGVAGAGRPTKPPPEVWARRWSCASRHSTDDDGKPQRSTRQHLPTASCKRVWSCKFGSLQAGTVRTRYT